MISHRRQKWNAGCLQWPLDRGLKAFPHRCELAVGERRFLASHHVTGTNHQIGLLLQQKAHAPFNTGAIAGAAVRAVEIADQPDPDRVVLCLGGSGLPRSERLRSRLLQQDLQGRSRCGGGHKPQNVSPSGLFHQQSLCLKGAMVRAAS